MKKITSTVIVVICIILTFSFVGCNQKKTTKRQKRNEPTTETTTIAPKEIEIPISSDEAIKMKYNELSELLIKSGFSVIDSSELGDLSDRNDKTNDYVQSISINGKQEFKKNEKVMSNSPIVIKYHSVKWLDVPVVSSDLEYKDMNYNDVITKFKNAGYTKVSSRAVEDNSKPEGTAKEIIIDGDSDLHIAAPIDSTIVISYYTQKKTSPPETTTPTEKPTEKPTEAPKNNASGVNPEFKAYMDSYETTMNGYVEFMKKYNENPSDPTLMNEYMTWLTSYSEQLEALEEIDEDELSPEDYKYYIEVTTRVNKKLLEVA